MAKESLSTASICFQNPESLSLETEFQPIRPGRQQGK